MTQQNCGILSFGRKRSFLKRIRGYDTGEEGVSTIFLSNDKNNVIVDKVLSYF